MKKILVIGATGQIGSELTPALRQRYGSENVIAAGHAKQPSRDLLEAGPYITLDILDSDSVAQAVQEHRVDAIYHLAALLSVKAEENPQLAWTLNMNGLQQVLELARMFTCAVFFPSSIGAFGPTTPKSNTPQLTIQRPNTMYGVTKAAGELLCDYYFLRYGVDVRGVRFPGLISYKTIPGGGTTDYAVEMFYGALQEKKYVCPVKKGTYLDMMYMPDAVTAALEIMEADQARLKFRNATILRQRVFPRMSWKRRYGNISLRFAWNMKSILCSRQLLTVGLTIWTTVRPVNNGVGIPGMILQL